MSDCTTLVQCAVAHGPLWISSVGGVATLFVGVATFFVSNRRNSESRYLEASRPFLDRQLLLYTETTQVVSKLATSEDAEEMGTTRKRFEELYWGELALVERQPVVVAMIAFRKALVVNADQDTLKDRALAVAHACRDELAESWRTDAWRQLNDR